MSTPSLVIGLSIIVLAAGLRILVIIKKYTNVKDRTKALISLPNTQDRADELFLLLFQVIGMIWFLMGILLKAFKMDIIPIPTHFVGIGNFLIFLSPIYLILLILFLISKIKR